MEQQTGQMMTPGSQSVELAVHHVRDPGQGMPISSVTVELGERPDQARPGQASLDSKVIGHVKVVVVINKSISQGGEEYADDECQQQNTKGYRISLAEEAEGQPQQRGGGFASFAARGSRKRADSCLVTLGRRVTAMPEQRASTAHICSNVSIPSTSRPCFKTRAVKSHKTRRLARCSGSDLSTGQFS